MTKYLNKVMFVVIISYPINGFLNMWKMDLDIGTRLDKVSVESIVYSYLLLDSVVKVTVIPMVSFWIGITT